MNSHNRYPVIKKLLVVQLASVCIGMLCICLMINYHEKGIVSAAIEKNNTKIRSKIEESQEMLRAWHALGMNEAFDAEVDDLKKEYPIKLVEVVRRDDTKNIADDGYIIVPEDIGPDTYIYYELDREKIANGVIVKSGAVALVVIVGCLLLLLVVYSTLYIKKYIYAPISGMIREFDKMRTTGSLNFDSVHAQGEIAQFVDEIREMYRRIKEAEKMRTECEISKQVAHDIRSPLAALMVSMSHLKTLPEEQRLVIRSAVQRINDIANDLARKNDDTHKLASSDVEEKVSKQLLSSLIDTLISEKRAQYRNRSDVVIDSHIDASSFGLFAIVQPVIFKRVLSNLINNSVEAINRDGKVSVSLVCEEESAVLRVSDNGKGIPGDVLPNLMRMGMAYAKPGGSGLGLYHARINVEKWGGGISIQSKEGKETTVMIRLPCCKPPRWFVPAINIRPHLSIVIVDDDDSIHRIWQGRFEKNSDSANMKLYHFRSPDEFIRWYHQQKMIGDSVLFLIDQEYVGYSACGLEMIDNLNIQEDSILVTSHFEDANVRAECGRLGVRLIPKNLVGFVPIVELSNVRSHSITRQHRGLNITKNVLIINDEEFMRTALKFELKKWGAVQVIEAAGVSDAFRVLKENSIDIVLADINLGEDRDGYDILREVRAQSKTTKFYMMSGMQKEDEWPKAREMGADGYIQVPFEVDELRKVMV